MNRSLEELQQLAGPEFNRILAEDSVLAELEKQKYNKILHSRVLMDCLGLGDYRIGNLPVRPLTAAKWAFLWMLGSPLVCGGGQAGGTDLDVALFILSCQDLRKLNCSLAEIPGAAAGMTRATGLPETECLQEVYSEIRSAFLPLEMLPRENAGDDGDHPFDGMWVTHIAGTAARESGMPFMVCLHEYPLAGCCCLFVNSVRRKTKKPEEIRYRTPEEIRIRMDERIEELADAFLKKP